MAVAPTSVLSLVVHRTRTLIASSPDFRTWAGAADQAAALAHGKLYRVPEGSIVYPLFLVRGLAHNQDRVGNSGRMDDDGIVEVLFEDEVLEANEDSDEDAFTAFLNNVGLVRSWMGLNQGQENSEDAANPFQAYTAIRTEKQECRGTDEVKGSSGKDLMQTSIHCLY